MTQVTSAKAPRAALLLTLALALALTLALAGCAGAAHASGPTLIPTPTPTFALGGKFATATAESWTPTPNSALLAPVAGAQARWTSANLPANFGLAFHSSWMGVSANNGNVAYSCDQEGSPPGTTAPPVETVKTTNGGASWARVADLNQSWDGCGYITIDANNPNIVVISGMNGQSDFASSRDGGMSWQTHTANALGAIGQLASVGSRTYALFVQGQTDALAVSVDGLATWRNITGPMAGQGLTTFWANGATGALLAETKASFPGAVTLWQSSDGGASWSSVAPPFASVGGVVARATTSGAAPWTICLDSGDNLPGAIACSTNGGARWTSLPLFDDSGLSGYGVIGIAGDGAVLAEGGANTFQRLYRLPHGATRWQSLGDLPATNGTLLYAPTTGSGGLLWSLPSVKGGGSGDANPSDIYVARYPY